MGRRISRPREGTTKTTRVFYESFAKALEALERAKVYGRRGLEIKADAKTGQFYLERISPEK